jgi:hypothetical protein
MQKKKPFDYLIILEIYEILYKNICKNNSL